MTVEAIFGCQARDSKSGVLQQESSCPEIALSEVEAKLCSTTSPAITLRAYEVGFYESLPFRAYEVEALRVTCSLSKMKRIPKQILKISFSVARHVILKVPCYSENSIALVSVKKSDT